MPPVLLSEFAHGPGYYRIFKTMSREKTDSLKALGRRLRRVRKAANLGLAELARRVGCSAQNLSSIERGEWGPSGSLVLNICRDLNLNEKWLTEGTGPIYKEAVREAPARYGFQVPPGIPEDIPVVGQGRGGRGQFSGDGYPVGQGYKRVRRPFDVRDRNAFAVEVTGDSMAPRYEAGDIVICSPAKSYKTGDYCVIIKRDDEVLIKKIRDLGDHLLLTSVNPAFRDLEMAKSDIRAIHKIVWKKER